MEGRTSCGAPLRDRRCRARPPPGRVHGARFCAESRPSGSERVRELIEARTPAAASASARRLAGAFGAPRGHSRRALAAAADRRRRSIFRRMSARSSRKRCVADSSRRSASSIFSRRPLPRDSPLQGARVALPRRPNAGKSTLFNAAGRSDRAIVTTCPANARHGRRDDRSRRRSSGGRDTAACAPRPSPWKRWGWPAPWKRGGGGRRLYVFDAVAGVRRDTAALSRLAPMRSWSRPTDRPRRRGSARGAGPRHPVLRVCASPRTREGPRGASRSFSKRARARRIPDPRFRRQRDLVLGRAMPPRARWKGRTPRVPGIPRVPRREALAAFGDLFGDTTPDDVLGRYSTASASAIGSAKHPPVLHRMRRGAATAIGCRRPRSLVSRGDGFDVLVIGGGHAGIAAAHAAARMGRRTALLTASVAPLAACPAIPRSGAWQKGSSSAR